MDEFLIGAPCPNCGETIHQARDANTGELLFHDENNTPLNWHNCRYKYTNQVIHLIWHDKGWIERKDNAD